jgi:adenylate kinase
LSFIDAGHRAVLLLGPTGSGKTPLGDLIAKRGLWQARCVHFDFGAALRRIVDRNRPDRLFSREDVDFLRRVLQSGALLEKQHFSIAERMLRSFLAAPEVDAHTVIVLNGLPRHVEQAEFVDAILHVEAVIHLRSTSRTVLARIRANVGGDRAGRQDDAPESVRLKLELYQQRTCALVDHYRALGARIETIEVTAAMTPEEMWERLHRRA